MLDLQRLIKDGMVLEKDFDRLDDYIFNQRHLENNNGIAIRMSLAMLTTDIESFNTRALKYIEDTRQYVNSTLIYSENRQNSNIINEYGLDSPMVTECYICGNSIKQILNELDSVLKGIPIKKKDRNCSFIYSPEHRAIYKNNLGDSENLEIRSRKLKRETLCKLVFKERFKSVSCYAIEDKRIEDLEKIEYVNDDEKIKEPYQWTKDASDELNKKMREKFGIDYDLFITDQDFKTIRLNTMAKINKKF